MSQWQEVTLKTVKTNEQCHGQKTGSVLCKEDGKRIHNQGADGTFSLEIAQLAHFKLRDVCEPKGNGAFVYSLHAIMWVSSELV